MANNQDPSSKKPNTIVESHLNDLVKTLENRLSQAFIDAGKDQKEFKSKVDKITRNVGSQIKTMSRPGIMESIVTKELSANDTLRTMSMNRRDLSEMSTSDLQSLYQHHLQQASSRTKSLRQATELVQVNKKGEIRAEDKQIINMRQADVASSVQEAAIVKAALRQQVRAGTSAEKEGALVDTMLNKTDAISRNKNLKDMLREVKQTGSYETEAATLATRKTEFEKAYQKKILKQEELGFAQETKLGLEERLKSAQESQLNAPDNERIRQEVEDAAKALEDFANSLETATKEAKEASEGFSKATQNLEEQQKRTIVASSREENRGAGFRSIASAGEAAAEEIRYLAVGQRMREQQATNSIAAYGLKKYDRSFAATQGDVQSLYETLGSMSTKEFANKMYDNDIGSRALQEVAKAGGYAAEVSGALHQDAGKAYIAGVKLTGQAARTIGGEFQINAAETQVNAAELKDQYNKIMSAFRAKGGQRIYDQFVGSLGATVGAGSTTLEGKLTDTASLKNALDKGNLSPSELLNLSTQVNESVRGTQHDRYDIAVRAGEMEKRGVMGAGQYIQAMSAQSGIGGTQAGLESNLRRAFAAGINDSKLLTEFVELNAGLNQGLANIGIAMETNNAFANKAQELRGMGMSEALASKAAANSVTTIGKFMTGGGMGPEEMAHAATARSTIQKVTGKSASDAMIQAAMSSDAAALQAILGDKALSKAEQDRLTEGQFELYQASRSTTGEGRKALRKGLTQDAFRNKLSVYGPEDAQRLATSIFGMSRGDVSRGGFNIEEAREAESTSQAGAGQKAKNIAASAQFKEYKEIADSLGGAVKAFDSITTAMGKIQENLSAISAQKETEKQAKELKLDAGAFPDAVKLFGTYVEQLTGQKLTPAEAAKLNNKPKNREMPSKNTGTSRRAGYQTE